MIPYTVNVNDRTCWDTPLTLRHPKYVVSAKENYLLFIFFSIFLNTLSKITGELWTFNHLVLSSKHIEGKMNLLNYRMANFKGITPLWKSNPWFTTAILFFKAYGWSSCFVKLLISCKEYWMLSNQNARKDVIIPSYMCIFHTLVLMELHSILKWLVLVPLSGPKTASTGTKMSSVSIKKGVGHDNSWF